MSDKERALAALRQANEALERRTADFERAVAAHDRSMEIVLRRRRRPGGRRGDERSARGRAGDRRRVGHPVARTPGAPEEVVPAMLVAATGDVGRSGRSVRDGAYWVTGLVAGTEHLGMLVWSPPAGRGDVDGQDRQLLERAAVVGLPAPVVRPQPRRSRGEGARRAARRPPRTHAAHLSSLAERAQRSGYDPANATRSSSRTYRPNAGGASAPPRRTSRPPATG